MKEPQHVSGLGMTLGFLRPFNVGVATDYELSLQFQTFTAVPIVGDQSQVVPFLVAKHEQIAPQIVSTKAT